MRNKNQILRTPSSQAQLHFCFSASSAERRRGTGNGGCGQFITRCLCRSFLLTLCPCSSTGSLPWRQSSVNCSSVGPPQGHKPCQQTCSSVGSSLHGSTGSGRSLLQHGAPHRVTASFRQPSALAWGPFHGPQVEICSTVDLHELQGTACLIMGCPRGCRGMYVSVPGAPPPPPSALTLVSAELFSHILIPPAAMLVCRVFSPA